jgi:hypothetical protein
VVLADVAWLPSAGEGKIIIGRVFVASSDRVWVFTAGVIYHSG